MSAELVLVLTAGTPVRLEEDCPECGWADLWAVTVHSISTHGVGTMGIFTGCARCRQSSAKGRGDARPPAHP